MTSNLARRIYEHRIGAVAGFTKRYALKRLVYFESFDDIQTAIQREHNIKHWSRAWKVRLILASNPNGDDLFETLWPEGVERMTPIAVWRRVAKSLSYSTLAPRCKSASICSRVPPPKRAR